jgi:hypothetical protein
MLTTMPVSVKVVDSWALVAWVKQEPSALLVRHLLLEADAGNLELAMSWIKVAEERLVWYSRRRDNTAVPANGCNRPIESRKPLK